MTSLIGDSNIFTLYQELAGKDLFYQDLLKEKEILTNLYYHLIRDGAQALRIPSIHCYKIELEKQKLYHQIEQILGLLVSSAKQAIKRTGADILILGVISYSSLVKGENFWKEMHKNISETVIYLSDFGIDAIFIEGITNWKIMKKTLDIVEEQCPHPIAPFFALQNFKKGELENYLTTYKKLHLEMLGIEIEPRDFIQNKQKISLLEQNQQIGFLLNNCNSTASINLATNFFKKIKPLALFGGNQIKRKWWNNFCQKYFG